MSLAGIRRVLFSILMSMRAFPISRLAIISSFADTIMKHGSYSSSAKNEKNAAEKVGAGNEHGQLCRHRQAESGEILPNIGQVVELAPAALSKLPSPIEPH